MAADLPSCWYPSSFRTIAFFVIWIRLESADFPESVSQIGKRNLYSPAYPLKLLPLFSEKQKRTPSFPRTMRLGRKQTGFEPEAARYGAVTWRKDWYYQHVYNTALPRRPIVKCEGVRTNDWKDTRYPEIAPPYEQLFELHRDPREEHNLASDPAHAQTLGRLRGRCDEVR
jgi:hypothetical protein